MLRLLILSAVVVCALAIYSQYDHGGKYKLTGLGGSGRLPNNGIFGNKRGLGGLGRHQFGNFKKGFPGSRSNGRVYNGGLDSGDGDDYGKGNDYYSGPGYSDGRGYGDDSYGRPGYSDGRGIGGGSYGRPGYSDGRGYGDGSYGRPGYSDGQRIGGGSYSGPGGYYGGIRPFTGPIGRSIGGDGYYDPRNNFGGPFNSRGNGNAYGGGYGGGYGGANFGDFAKNKEALRYGDRESDKAAIGVNAGQKDALQYNAADASRGSSDSNTAYEDYDKAAAYNNEDSDHQLSYKQNKEYHVIDNVALNTSTRKHKDSGAKYDSGSKAIDQQHYAEEDFDKENLASDNSAYLNKNLLKKSDSDKHVDYLSDQAEGSQGNEIY